MNADRLALARAAVSRGVSLLCATCDHYVAARVAGLPGDACGRVGCVGPFGGGEFPDYQGPIEDPSRWCIACGAESVRGVRVAGGTKTFGLCGSHVALAHDALPASGASPLLEVVSPTFVPAELVRRVPPRVRSRGSSIVEILAEVAEGRPK